MDDRVGIVGLGYVGLPLGLAFLNAGCEVVGYDENQARLEMLRAGRSPIDDVSDSALAGALGRGMRLRSPAEGGRDELDAIFVCVPTPISAAREPDLTAVLAAARQVGQWLSAGQMVILQSTTWPGTTSGPFRAELERSGLVAGRDFALAFAPERISPGDGERADVRLPRLVGGISAADTDRAASLLGRLGGAVTMLSSADAAELAKLLENVFRNVNIALVNEVALLSERIGLDVWEVIDAAATKPFGFMAFRPGPGVGGHCIPVDPYYLSWRARQVGLDDRFLAAATDINSAMPVHVADLAVQALDRHDRAIEGAQIGVIGAAFKPNIGDARNSPARDVMAELARRGARTRYHDPHVPRFADAAGTAHESAPLEEVLATSDVLVALVHHAAIDWARVYGSGVTVVDAVNSSRGHDVRSGQVLRLGAGWS